MKRIGVTIGLRRECLEDRRLKQVKLSGPAEEGKTLAVASIYRDLESLQAELAMERRDEKAVRELVAPAGG